MRRGSRRSGTGTTTTNSTEVVSNFTVNNGANIVNDLIVHNGTLKVNSDIDRVGILCDSIPSSELEVNGTITSTDLTVNDTIKCNSLIKSSYSSGEIIKISWLNWDDIGMDSTVNVISGTEYTPITTFSYTPLSTSSYLMIEADFSYLVSGNGGDTIQSRITIDNVQRASKKQLWTFTTSSGGGGTRSGTIFPIGCRYTNTSITSKSISINVKRTGTDDGIYVNCGEMGYVKITEIQK